MSLAIINLMEIGNLVKHMYIQAHCQAFDMFRFDEKLQCEF